MKIETSFIQAGNFSAVSRSARFLITALEEISKGENEEEERIKAKPQKQEVK